MIFADCWNCWNCAKVLLFSWDCALSGEGLLNNQHQAQTKLGLHSFKLVVQLKKRLDTLWHLINLFVDIFIYSSYFELTKITILFTWNLPWAVFELQKTSSGSLWIVEIVHGCLAKTCQGWFFFSWDCAVWFTRVSWIINIRHKQCLASIALS